MSELRIFCIGAVVNRLLWWVFEAFGSVPPDYGPVGQLLIGGVAAVALFGKRS
jgi:apolipoprotein N-acyltransferase